MDNEIEKKLSIIVENSELGFYDEAFANPVELFSNLMGKQKESMEEVLVKFFSNKLTDAVLVKVISKVIINSPDLLQKITNIVLDNIRINVEKK